jgi:hypothetical protein
LPLGGSGFNAAAGICLQARPNAGTLAAQGNTFETSNCATTAAVLTINRGACGGFNDLGVVGVGNDINVAMCTHP